MTTKTELASLTTSEAAALFRDNPVILIPMGSTEQHGPTTPVGDYRYTTVISSQIAEKTGAVSCPTIPWGYSEYFRSFAGTITIRPETLTLLLEDHIDSLVRFGLDHIMFVCGHKGDLPILEQVARRTRRTHGLRVATIEPLAWFTPEWKKQLYETDAPSTGHGTDPMLSLAMHLVPDEVRMDLVEDEARVDRGEVRHDSASQARLDGNVWHPYLDYEELTSNGVLGDARLASSERGARIVERVVGIGADMVRTFAGLETRVEAR